MRPHLIRPVLLVLCFLGVSSCAARAPGEPGLDAAQTTLEVENRSWLEMNVYVLDGGQRIRLGTVSGVSTQVFEIPSSLIFGLTPLRFLADPLGGDAGPVSQEITVAPGDHVKIVIPSR